MSKKNKKIVEKIVPSKQNKIFYFFIGLLFLLNIFTILKIYNLENKLNQNPNSIEKQPKPPQKVKIEDVRKLFTKDYIHFGKSTNKLLFVEVSDPSCPFCHIAAGFNPQLSAKVNERFKYKSDGGSYIPPVPEIKKLVNQGKASYAYLYSSGRGNGLLASETLYCAYEKGKFWEVYEKLMSNDGYNLINEQVKNDKTKIPDLVSFLSNEVDSDFLTKCLESGKYEKSLSRDQQLSPNLGFQGTPHFLINTQMFQGAYNFSDMKPVIDKYL